jgi:hypothetical protein
MPVSGIRVVDAKVWLALVFSDHARHRASPSARLALGFFVFSADALGMKRQPETGCFILQGRLQVA